jgi:hypothetical protein
MEPEPEIRITKPLPVDRESKRGPTLILSVIFTVGLAVIVLPLAGFIFSISMGWQAGLNASIFALKWGMIGVGALLAYGAAVGLYHTFLAITGLDRGERNADRDRTD